MRRSLRRGLLAALGVLVVVLAYGYLGVIRPMWLRGEQIANLVDMRGYDSAVQQYREKHGKYPLALGEAIREGAGADSRFQGNDRYGHRVLYHSDGQSYLLVSYGRDGKPDGTDYEALRRAGEREEKCKDFDADQIFSDRGELRSCGK